MGRGRVGPGLAGGAGGPRARREARGRAGGRVAAGARAHASWRARRRAQQVPRNECRAPVCGAVDTEIHQIDWRLAQRARRQVCQDGDGRDAGEQQEAEAHVEAERARQRRARGAGGRVGGAGRRGAGEAVEAAEHEGGEDGGGGPLRLGAQVGAGYAAGGGLLLRRSAGRGARHGCCRWGGWVPGRVLARRGYVRCAAGAAWMAGEAPWRCSCRLCKAFATAGGAWRPRCGQLGPSLCACNAVGNRLIVCVCTSLFFVDLFGESALNRSTPGTGSGSEGGWQV